MILQKSVIFKPMISSDVLFIFQWWVMIFTIGIIFLPLTVKIFSSFLDKGYIFSKILGIVFISYIVFIFGTFKILPFTQPTIFLTIGTLLTFNLFLIYKYPNILISLKKYWKIFIFEEALFIGGLTFWSFIRAHQPDIHGLEKYMDFGFINSILRSDYFPAKDMWFTPFAINYYYFGHLVTAVLTKISNIPSSITFNLMVSTIFAFVFTESFSIGGNLIYLLKLQTPTHKSQTNSNIQNTKSFGFLAFNNWKLKIEFLIGGLLTAFLVSFAGNFHILYSFFTPYINETPVPIWTLKFIPFSFPNSYWYPNATRFIFNTIHEFPLYSFVVSDLHGHVLDIPIVLLTIAVLLSLIKFKIFNFSLLTLLAFLLAIMYMTNAWDGFIYFLLASTVIFYIERKANKILILFIGFLLFALPFSIYFQTGAIAHGIGILCAPKFITDIGRLGPFLFEADHCQKSPLWQLIILYGFFYFWVIIFLKHLKFIENFKLSASWRIKNLPPSDVFVLILILLATLLIIIPEFIYIKDIYPAHYRANTMFKLVYQSFIMLSLSTGYIMIRLGKNKLILLFAIISFAIVMIYPYLAVPSYYENLRTYKGLDGTAYLKTIYLDDYQAILWLNKNIKGQPVILEAQGDSYTDYARISANTGLPTVLGWLVHEWLWRGSYDVPSPRISEVQNLYETKNIDLTKELIKKYNIGLVFIGDLELQKYPNLNEEKFKTLGKIVFQKNRTKIYKITF